MQERGSRNAVRAAGFKASRIGRPGITADDVIARAPGIIRIIDTEFRVVKHVESLSAKFKLAGLGYLETLGQCHIEIELRRIVEKVTAGVAEGKSARRHKLSGIQ